MKNTRIIRVDPDFAQDLRNIKLDRVKNGMDKEFKTDRRLTRAIKNHSLWQTIKKDLASLQFKYDKRGGLMDTFVWIIIAFVIIAFFIVFLYGFNIMTNILTTIPSDSPIVNVSQAATDTFGQVNSAAPNGLRYLAIAILFAMMLSIFISNYLIKADPIYFVIYVLVTVIAVIFSAYVSNAYESSILNSQILGQTALSFPEMNFIFLHLPIWATVIGVVGAAFLFFGIFRNEGSSA